jgi:hypothetical protein
MGATRVPSDVRMDLLCSPCNKSQHRKSPFTIETCKKKITIPRRSFCVLSIVSSIAFSLHKKLTDIVSKFASRLTERFSEWIPGAAGKIYALYMSHLCV